MMRAIKSMAAAVAVASCGASPLVTASSNSGGGTTTAAIPADLAVNVNKIVYDPGTTPGGGTIQIEIASLDTTPLTATFTRDASLDVTGYKAFRMQEDALDRMFIALAAESADGSVRAATVGDGGQFNRYFAGGYYERDGAFDAPPVNSATPGSGQVSYAGSYAAVTNVGLAAGGPTDVTLPIPAGTDPSLTPSQPARVAGDIFLNANFADSSVNGSIYNRVIVDSGFSLDDVILVAATIDGNGTFAGTTENPAQVGTGTYGGIFGGTDAAAVAGVVHLEEFESTWTNEQEHGVFVLTQCGLPGSAPICATVAP
ncbi:transferrin-binding protein-like solute binding protein [Phaeovulum vinaykumarii]|nr:transferrin-binding protein-like solute binding protein [Phaeovulum vinaykumarii]